MGLWGGFKEALGECGAPLPIPGPLGVSRDAENPSPEHRVLVMGVRDRAGLSVMGQLQGDTRLFLAQSARDISWGDNRKEAGCEACVCVGGAWDPHRPDHTLQPQVAPAP